MKTRAIGWLGVTLMSGWLSLNSALAEDHKVLATQEAMAAAESAQKGDSAACLERAESAKAHAEAALKERSNPHLDAGIRNLNESIEEARKGNTSAAGEAADAAATHLKAAEKSM